MVETVSFGNPRHYRLSWGSTLNGDQEVKPRLEGTQKNLLAKIDLLALSSRGAIMPVFISHRTADDAKAQALAQRLHTKHNIRCYVNDFDPEAKTTREITNLIVNRINICTHLMALVTNATVGSWWVPFEIGVARQGERRITSFDSSTVELPEFLTEWPVMTSETDLDLFAEAYHRDRAAKPLMEKYASASRSIHTPDEFHAALKSAIRNRRFV